MSADADNKGTLLVLNVLEALCGFAAQGARNADLVALVGKSAPYISRSLDVLTAKGWARKDENGRYYPTPAFTRMAFAVLGDFSRVQTRLDDTKRSMTGL
jgi:DNA-binding IclR family transcriptional regulator